MVKEFRCQKIKQKIWSPSEPPASRLFSEPQWQEHVSLWYFLYRWFIFGLWSVIIICSIFEFGAVHPVGRRQFWPIYLTHWDLILGVGQTLLGAILVTRRRSLQQLTSFDPNSLTLGKTEYAYWVLYTLSSCIAIGVTILYWGAIHNPKIHDEDALNFMMHLCNTVLILFDLIVVSVPLRVKHFWWPLAGVTFYLMFTLFFYLAGGVDKKGHHYIYKLLDWQQPGRTLLFCLGGLLFLTFVHCILCLFVWLRNYTRRKFYSSPS